MLTLAPLKTHKQWGYQRFSCSLKDYVVRKTNLQLRIPCAMVSVLLCVWLFALAPGVAAQAPAPVLISESNSTRALALESVAFTREPFPLDSLISWSPDRRTRVVLFALNLQLQAGEDPSSITADAEDATHRHYALRVENAGPVPGNEWMSALTIRLSDDLSDVGDVLVGIVNKGRSSNRVRIAIGHLGGGPTDDPAARPTSPYLLRGSVSADGAALPGAAVLLQGEGSTVGDVTDGNGKFRIATVGGDYVLSVSKSFYDFNPPIQTFNNLTQALDGVNFTASRQRRTIQGVARDDNGQALPNVEISLTSNGIVPRKTLTDATGVFNFADLPAGAAYSITPTDGNIFAFTPQTIDQLSNTTTLTFTAVRRSYTISGRVINQGVGIADAVVTIPATAATSISDASGNYSFSGVPAGLDYVLSVSKPFYDFNPPTQTISNLSQPVGAVDFVASRQKRTIQGVAIDDEGHAVPNVEMTLTSSAIATTKSTTNATGVFSFAEIPVGFAYTVSPGSHTFFAFTSQTIDQLIDTSMLSFSGVRRSYSLSGRITTQNAGIPNVVLKLKETGATSLSDASGNYSFPAVKAGFAYTLLATEEDYVLEPASLLISQFDGTRQFNFAGTPHVFLKGRVLDQQGRGVFGVKVNVSGTQTGVAATAADGSYSFLVTAFGNYTLTPEKEQNYYSFTPSPATLTAFKGSRDADFSAVLNTEVSPSHVLEFDGTQKTVDYSMPILAPFDYNLFWPDGRDFGHFFWEFWAMPGENAGATYMISDGYGGAHAILFGVANFGSREPNRYQLLGNIWNGSYLTYFASDEGPAPYEWGHYAVGWDGKTIVTYFNGVPVGAIAWEGPRITPGGIQGCGRLLIGGSDHANFIGRIAQVRGYEQNNPRENSNSVFATFAPQTVFSVDGNLLSYFFHPSQNIADLSPIGQYGRQHPGLLKGTSNGVTWPCDGCPVPQFVVDPTAPDFAHPNNPGTLAAPVDTPAKVPDSALIFDSFSRQNSTYVLSGLGGLGSTEGGSAGSQTWHTNQAAAQPQPFGILNGKAVLLADATAIAWTSVPASSADIRVDRHAGFFGTGHNTGLSFRVADANNYFFAYSSDNPDPSQPQTATIGYYSAGVRTELATGILMPTTWTTLRAVTTDTGTISLFADGTLLYSTSNTMLAGSPGAGLYNNGPGLALTNRWDNFAVFGLP